MKPEIETNIKWFLATKTLPPDNVSKVLILCTAGYITTISACRGHFNCSYIEDINCENEFIPGKDVLYWAYIPEQLSNCRYKYKVTDSES